MQPAYANFKFLSQLYGTVDGSPVPSDDAVNGGSNSVNASTVSSQNSGNGRGGNRALGGGVSGTEWLPAAVTDTWHAIDRLVDNGLIGTAEDGWRMLHENPHGHAHEINVGNGLAVRVFVLH